MPKTNFTGWKGGLNKAKQPHEISPEELAEAQDIVRRSERWTKRPGWTAPYSATSEAFPITALTDFVKRDQSVQLVAGDRDGLLYLNGTSWTRRLNLSVTQTDKDKWFFAEIGDALYAVNKAAGEVYRTANVGTTNFAAVTWDTAADPDGETGVDIQAAAAVLALNQRLWFFNVTTNTDGNVPEQVRWTEVNDFDRSETTNFLNLSGSHSGIVSAGVLLSQLIAVYREDLVHIIQNPGVPVASPRGTFEPGIVGPYAWTKIPGGGHFYVAQSGFYIFTGGVPQPMGRDKTTEYYLGLVRESDLANVHCWTDLRNEELYIHFPTGESSAPNKALVYNWSKNCWSEWNITAYCGMYRYRKVTATTVLFGEPNGIVGRQGGTTDNGNAINPVLRTKVWTITPPNQVHELPDIVQINQIDTDIIEPSPGAATIKVDCHDTGTDTPSYTSYLLNDTDGWMPDANIVPEAGRYVSVQVEGFTSITELIIDWNASSTK